MSRVDILVILQSCLITQTLTFQPPHIIFILADDMGWNDVSFHGSDEIPTPNIDSLAYSGVILNRHYGLPICTPSRAAILTGKYPIRTGMQHRLIMEGEPRGLPLTEKLLPEFLNDIGYTSHLVGKWHLGYYKKEYTPTYRGFNSHLGYWNGYQDYYDHNVQANLLNKTVWGLDMRRNMNVAWDLNGKYSTEIYTNESINIIKQHDNSKPLFLFLSQIAPHTGSPYNPNAVPDEVAAMFSSINDYDRRRYAGMMSILDDGIGRIFEALHDKDMLKNSIIVFSSDNGGAVQGYMDRSTASNYPLRGSKRTLWEGGVRLAAFIWSPLLNKSSVISTNYVHLTDWLPTFISAANATQNTTKLDGVSQWNALSKGDSSVRDEILLNIDPLEKERYGALIKGKWKIVKGRTTDGKYDYRFGPPSTKSDIPYFIINKIKESRVNKILKEIGMDQYVNKISDLREEATVECDVSYNRTCQAQITPCLFDIETDPCETTNLADKYPNKLKQLEELLNVYDREQIAPNNKKQVEYADPARHNYVWTNFGESSTVSTSPSAA